jgi:hypothetical protein
MLFVLHHELGNEEAAQKHKKLGLPHAKRAYPAGSPIWESWRTGKWKER